MSETLTHIPEPPKTNGGCGRLALIAGLGFGLVLLGPERNRTAVCMQIYPTCEAVPNALEKMMNDTAETIKGLLR